MGRTSEWELVTVIIEAQCGKWNDGATGAGSRRGRFVPANLASSAMNEATEEFGRGRVSHAQLASAKGVTGASRPTQSVLVAGLENMVYRSGKSQGIWWEATPVVRRRLLIQGSWSSACFSELPRYCFRSVAARRVPTHRVSLLLDHHFVIAQYDTIIKRFFSA
jgi:hypothetical protein